MTGVCEELRELVMIVSPQLISRQVLEFRQAQVAPAVGVPAQGLLLGHQRPLDPCFSAVTDKMNAIQ